jgi:formylglycine-generating enzyme required for sulfatase activity
MKWVFIPGGSFEMGCSQSDSECLDDESPPHSVELSAFELLETEVTEAQFEAIMGFNPSCSFGGFGGAGYPVECVNWHSAKAFCLSVGGRLATEAEWEYAARGGSTTRYHCGDDPKCLNEFEWYGENAWQVKHPVKKLKPNAYGLHDMLGNINEWTNDWYSAKYYEDSPSDNPDGPESGSYRVARGSIFMFSADTLRVSRRWGYPPLIPSSYFGIRCARSL